MRVIKLFMTLWDDVFTPSDALTVVQMLDTMGLALRSNLGYPITTDQL